MMDCSHVRGTLEATCEFNCIKSFLSIVNKIKNETLVSNAEHSAPQFQIIVINHNKNVIEVHANTQIYELVCED